MKNRLICIAIVFALIAFVGGCGEQPPAQQPNQARTAVSKPRPAVVTPEAVAEEEKAPEYVYNPLGKRDPFENPLRALAEITTETGRHLLCL